MDKHNPEPWDPIETPEAAIFSEYRATGLIKVCPRCGRYGTVAVKIEDKVAWFAILWEGPARHPNPGLAHDIDIMVRPAHLNDPNMGCGYD